MTIAAGTMHIVSGAVSPAPVDRLSFFVNTVQSQWGTLNPDWVARNERRGAPSNQIEVERVNILEAFERWGMPYYLKIDIEGSDTAVLRALLETNERPQYVSFESDINSYKQALRDIELLRSLGYRKFKPVQQCTIEGTHSRFSTRTGDDLEYTFERGASGPFGEDIAGSWLTCQECRRAYRTIFAKYWMVGHKSVFFPNGWHKARRKVETVLGRAGWHDLHASL
jgi:hypothetical protein